MAIRFHLDEHVDHDIATGLRTRGIDVTTTADAGLLRAGDEEHMAFALPEKRVIFDTRPKSLRAQPSALQATPLIAKIRR